MTFDCISPQNPAPSIHLYHAVFSLTFYKKGKVSST